MIESSQLEQVLKHLCDELGGDWLLTGGSLVRLIFDTSRGTEDIDLVNIAHPRWSSERQQEELFKFVRGIGLGPEWVNAAVTPFVRAIPDWVGECRLIREGTQGRVYRPSLTLFVCLKIQRGSPVDLEDIRSAVRSCGVAEFEETKLRKWLDEKDWRRFESVRGSLGGI